MRVVIESPLSAPDAKGFQDNYRYLLWCCRATWLVDKNHAIASHMINPWFMVDHDPFERQAGIGNLWVWERGVLHVFFTDLGWSRGMALAREHCAKETLAISTLFLREYHPESWAAFERGEWPPHMPGFVLDTNETARRAKDELVEHALDVAGAWAAKGDRAFLTSPLHAALLKIHNFNPDDIEEP